MVGSRCEVANCENPPRWILQTSEDGPKCLCTDHWQVIRQENPQEAYLYSPLAVVRVREEIGSLVSLEAE
jgi:hypothetical protein